MLSYIFSTLFVYLIIILALWLNSSLDGLIGTIIFWFLFLLSNLVLINLIKYVREYFIILFAKCHEIDQDYIDSQMKQYEESKNKNLE